MPGVAWWRGVPGACWAQPEGPGSTLDGRLDEPVAHVSWNDAVALARFERGRLPTEAEWELAARGGLEQAIYCWGDELEPGGQHRCNVWQGAFPDRDTAADGYAGRAPVDAFAPNGLGLHNTGRQRLGVVRGLVRHRPRDRPRRPARTGPRARQGDEGRLVPVPPFVLQPLPGRSAHRQHAGQLDGQLRHAAGVPARLRKRSGGIAMTDREQALADCGRRRICCCGGLGDRGRRGGGNKRPFSRSKPYGTKVRPRTRRSAKEFDSPVKLRPDRRCALGGRIAHGGRR